MNSDRESALLVEIDSLREKLKEERTFKESLLTVVDRLREAIRLTPFIESDPDLISLREARKFMNEKLNIN